jgi:hypothetical protein
MYPVIWLRFESILAYAVEAEMLLVEYEKTQKELERLKQEKKQRNV